MPLPRMGLDSGWEVFTTDPGLHEVMFCRVCGAQCDVKRNVVGPTSWSEAMAKKEHLHDCFTCLHTEEKWHQLVLALKQEQEELFSPSLKEIVQGDIDKVLRTRSML